MLFWHFLLLSVYFFGNIGFGLLIIILLGDLVYNFRLLRVRPSCCSLRSSNSHIFIFARILCTLCYIYLCHVGLFLTCFVFLSEDILDNRTDGSSGT